MGFNFGAFAQGLSQGIHAGQQISDMYDKYQIRKVTKDEMDKAGKMADALAGEKIKTEKGAAADSLTQLVDDSTNQNNVQQAQFSQDPSVTPKAAKASVADFVAPKETAAGNMSVDPSANQSQQITGSLNPVKQYQDRFRVGDAVFDNRESAMAEAKKGAPDQMALFLKHGASRVHAKYLEQGDPTKAAAWAKYVDGEQGRRNMETWANSYKSAMGGDFVGALDGVAKLYGAYDPDTKITNKEILKGEDDSPVGAVLTYERNGKTAQIHMDPNTLLEMGIGQLTPETMFDTLYKRKTQRDSDATKAKTEALQNESQMARALMIIKAGLQRQQMQGNQSMARQNAGHAQSIDRMMLSHDQRKSLEQIRQAYKIERSQSGGEAGFGKRRNPEDRIQAFALKLMDNPSFAAMSQDEIIGIAAATVLKIDGEAGKMRGNAPAQDGGSDDPILY